MELGTLGQTEASIISMIAVFSLGIELVVCFCWVRWVPLGALGWLLLHRKIRWVISVPRLSLHQKMSLFLCLFLSLPLFSLSPPLLTPKPSLSISFVTGYDNYGYGYGYGQDNTTNYGYGMATSNSWEMPSSDTNANPSAVGSTSADSVLSRINQRLDMVPHLETDMIQGGMYGSGGER